MVDVASVASSVLTMPDEVIAPDPTVPARVTLAPLNVAAVVPDELDLMTSSPLLLVSVPNRVPSSLRNMSAPPASRMMSVPASNSIPPASDRSSMDPVPVPWSAWTTIVSDVPPSAVRRTAFAPFSPDLMLMPPTSDSSCMDAEPSVAVVPVSLKSVMVEVVPPSTVTFTALARLAVERMPTPPASDSMVTDSAPSVTEVPWSEWILSVSEVPAFARR